MSSSLSIIHVLILTAIDYHENMVSIHHFLVCQRQFHHGIEQEKDKLSEEIGRHHKRKAWTIYGLGLDISRTRVDKHGCRAISFDDLL